MTAHLLASWFLNFVASRGGGGGGFSVQCRSWPFSIHVVCDSLSHSW